MNFAIRVSVALLLVSAIRTLLEFLYPGDVAKQALVFVSMAVAAGFLEATK